MRISYISHILLAFFMLSVQAAEIEPVGDLQPIFTSYPGASDYYREGSTQGSVVFREGHREFAKVWAVWVGELNGDVIQLQRFDSHTGEPIGTPTLLYVAAEHGVLKASHATIAYAQSVDEYAVVWSAVTKRSSYGTIAEQQVLFQRVSAANGGLIDVPRVLSTPAAVGSDVVGWWPVVAWDEDSEQYGVTWNSGEGFFTSRVLLQLLDVQGATIGSPITVSNYKRRSNTSVVATNGKFHVSWLERFADTGASDSIWLRSATADGFLENSRKVYEAPAFPYTSIMEARVAGHFSDGGLLFAWEEWQGDDWSVNMAIADSLGYFLSIVPLGVTGDGNDGFARTVAMPSVVVSEDDERLFLTWGDTRWSGPGQETYERVVLGQRLYRNGSWMDAEPSIVFGPQDVLGRKVGAINSVASALDSGHGNVFLSVDGWSYSGFIAAQTLQVEGFAADGAVPTVDLLLSIAQHGTSPVVSLVVTNAGDAEATQISVSAELANASRGSVRLSGCDTGGGKLPRCVIESLQPGESTELMLRVAHRQWLQGATVTARAFAEEPDANPDDNQITLDLSVPAQARPSPRIRFEASMRQAREERLKAWFARRR